MNFQCIEYIKMEDGTPKVQVVTKATGKDHNDVHYLFKLRRATRLIVGDDNMKGFSETTLQELHTAIVKAMIANSISHWYDTWDSDLDETLPDDLKLASSGYYPPADESIFDMEADDVAIRKVFMDEDVLYLWSAPTARKEVPSGHFLDPANKKYPYKNASGTINCGGLMAAYKAARGSRGAPKRPEIAAKAKRLLKSNCNKEVGGEKKIEEVHGHLTKI